MECIPLSSPVPSSRKRWQNFNVALFFTRLQEEVILSRRNPFLRGNGHWNPSEYLRSLWGWITFGRRLEDWCKFSVASIRLGSSLFSSAHAENWKHVLVVVLVPQSEALLYPFSFFLSKISSRSLLILAQTPSFATWTLQPGYREDKRMHFRDRTDITEFLPLLFWWWSSE